jgi:hypothetical protein
LWGERAEVNLRSRNLSFFQPGKMTKESTSVLCELEIAAAVLQNTKTLDNLELVAHSCKIHICEWIRAAKPLSEKQIRRYADHDKNKKAIINIVFSGTIYIFKPLHAYGNGYRYLSTPMLYHYGIF